MRAAGGDGRDDVVQVARDDDADRHLPVIRAVGRVERAAAGVEADFALHGGAEGALEGGGVEGADDGERRAEAGR